MIIKSIKDLSETSGSVCVTVGNENGEESFILSLGEWKRISKKTEYAPRELCEVSPELYDLISEGAKRTAALRSGAAVLSMGDKSKRELIKKLVMRGTKREYAEYAADFLEKKGYLNEADQAERAARSLVRGKHYGKRRVASYLASHGYPPEAVSAAVCSVDDEEYRLALSYNIKKKFMFILGPECSADQRKKAVAALMRLGFSYDEIKNSLKK